MTEPSSVLDVGPETFDHEVVERSRRIPVVVDFWAPWCGPCRQLGPILERLIGEELEGTMVLAKVNTEDNPELAQAWRVRGIPAVKIFRDGGVVSEFVGALPEAQVRQVLLAALPSEADRLAEQADALAAAGSDTEAEVAYRAAIDLDHMHARALFGLAQLLERGDDADQALAFYQRVPTGAAIEPEASRCAALLSLRRDAGQIGQLEALAERLKTDGDDIEARYGLALALAASERYREALEHLLAVVVTDRAFGDDAGRRATLRVFEVIGARSELADEFRGKLASALY